jgi:GTPase KRas protein
MARSITLGYEIQADVAEGRDLAKRFNAQCIETSAKQRVNVDEAFIAVVRAIRRYQNVGQPARLSDMS